ncbi:MAG: hypothetical protein GWP18_01165 [Proteobacteria bacterium]|nr:hypothetical protein [Pseudomonadota bacterium]
MTTATDSASAEGADLASPHFYEGFWTSRDDVPLDLVGKTVFALLVAYIVLNRVIADRFVLPVGASVRLYEIVLMMLGLAWMLWMMREPLPFPTGLFGLFALLTFALIGLAPFLNALTLTSFQTNGAERGLFRLFIFTTMFLAAYHLAFRVKRGFQVVGWVVAATVFQAGVAMFEFTTKQRLFWLDSLATSIGMIPDPQGIRAIPVGVGSRLTGEVRAASTAPHPIVLSAVVALGVLVVGTWLLYTGRTRQRTWLMVAGGVLVLALPVTNSRTAFVMLGVALLPIVILHVRKLPQILIWSLPMLAALALAFAISPETPRLLLNSVTNSGNDQNTQVRIERFSRVPELLEAHPMIGAGYLTHDVSIQLFDNAYNKAIIEFGVLGFASVIMFFLTALVTAWRATVRARDSEVVLPAIAVAAILSVLAAGATFDAWTFDQFFPTVLILMGVGLGRSAVILHRDRTEENTTNLSTEQTA